MVSMEQLTVIYLFYVLSRAQSEEDETFRPRIIHGYECDYNDFPFAVAIFGSYSCGGIIIALQWVLTAAHCISTKDIDKGNTWLRTGFHYGKEVTQTRVAKFGINHEKFSNAGLKDKHAPELRYDIGLIYCDKPFKEGTFLKTATLPTPGFTRDCERGIVAGIGLTDPEYDQYRNDFRSPNISPNRQLRCVDLRIIDPESCQDSWRNSVVDFSLVCTTVEKTRGDACKGDSGGGLYCKGTVIGIVSSGSGCANPFTSSTFTKVEAYLDFIEKTMDENTAYKVVGDWLKVLMLAIALNIFFD